MMLLWYALVFLLVLYLQVKFRFGVNLLILWLIIFWANFDVWWTVSRQTTEIPTLGMVILFEFLVYPLLLIVLLIHYFRLFFLRKINATQVISLLCLSVTIILVPLSSVLLHFRFYPNEIYRCSAILIYILGVVFSRIFRRKLVIK